MSLREHKILILSGPSGSGKSTLCNALKQNVLHSYFSVSCTTRPKREGEIDGREYFFTTNLEFEKQIQEEAFLEYTKVHNHYYGTPKSPVEEALKKNLLILFDVDVNGHKSIKSHYPHAKSVFITTPNDAVLQERLNKRGDNKESILARLHHAYEEMGYIEEFDYLIINTHIQESKDQVLCIAQSLFYATFDPETLIKNWKTL